MKFDVVIVGVGGQGNLLTSQTIAKCAMDAGYVVVNTETKGAAQRGGSVVSHVRISDGEIFSPLVAIDQADVLLGFEPLEALRAIRLLNRSGRFIINTQPIPTILSNLKVDEYPSQDQIQAKIKALGLKGDFINASREARALGNVLMTNVVMLGAFTTLCDLFSPKAVLDKLLGSINAKYHKDDIVAFERGRALLGQVTA